MSPCAHRTVPCPVCTGVAVMRGGRKHVECRADSKRVTNARSVAHFVEVCLFDGAAMNAGFGLGQDRIDAAHVLFERVIDGHRHRSKR